MSAQDDFNTRFDEMSSRLLSSIEERNEEFLENLRELVLINGSLTNEAISVKGAAGFQTGISHSVRPSIGVSEKAIEVFSWMRDEERKSEFMWRFTQVEFALAICDWSQASAYLMMLFDGITQDFLLPSSFRKAKEGNDSSPLHRLLEMNRKQTYWDYYSGKYENLYDRFAGGHLGWSLSRPDKLFIARGQEEEFWLFDSRIREDGNGNRYLLLNVDGKDQDVKFENSKALEVLFGLKIDGFYIPPYVLDSGCDLALSDFYVLLSGANDFVEVKRSDRVWGEGPKIQDVQVSNWVSPRVLSGSPANVYCAELSRCESYLNLNAPKKAQHAPKKAQHRFLSQEVNIGLYPLVARIETLLELLEFDKEVIKDLASALRSSKNLRDDYCHLNTFRLSMEDAESTLCKLMEELVKVVGRLRN
jgi:hypothetical protein